MKDPAFIKTLKEVPDGTVDEGHVEDLFKKFLHEKSEMLKTTSSDEHKEVQKVEPAQLSMHSHGLHP